MSAIFKLLFHEDGDCVDCKNTVLNHACCIQATGHSMPAFQAALNVPLPSFDSPVALQPSHTSQALATSQPAAVDQPALDDKALVHLQPALDAQLTDNGLLATVSDPAVKEEPVETEVESDSVAQVDDSIQPDKSLQAGANGNDLIILLVCVKCTGVWNACLMAVAVATGLFAGMLPYATSSEPRCCLSRMLSSVMPLQAAMFPPLLLRQDFMVTAGAEGAKKPRRFLRRKQK